MRLADALRDVRQVIVDRWRTRLRELGPARSLSRSQLEDHVPVLFDGMVDALDRKTDARLDPRLLRTPEDHAMERLDEGFDLEDVSREYLELRDVIMTVVAERHPDATLDAREVRAFNRMFDEALEVAVTRHARGRQRTLVALDRVAEAGLGDGKLDTFLPQLLKVMVETTAAVDSASVLLREGDRLRSRASFGLERQVNESFSLGIGEGFPGAIGARRTPMELKSSADPEVKSKVLRQSGLRALYGVPMLHGDELIGVAYMGSRSLDAFSAEDKLLFGALAYRAATLVEHHRAEQQIRDREEHLRVAVEAAGQGTWERNLITGEATWSAQNRAIFGIPAEVPVTQGLFLSRTHPEDRPRVLRTFDDAMLPTGARRFEIEFRVQPPGAPLRWVHARGETFFSEDDPPVPLRMLGTLTDITARKRREAQLHLIADASHRLAESIDYETTLRNVAHTAIPGFADAAAVDVMEASGEVRRVAFAHLDPAAEELGWEVWRRWAAKEREGSGLARALRGEATLEPELAPAALAPAVQDPEVRKLLERLQVHSLMVVPMRARGRILGALTFFMTTSGRRYTREDLEVAEELAERAASAIDNALLLQQAQSASRARETLLAVVSHDLKNPLHSIHLSTELLLRRSGVLDAGTRRQLENVRRAAARMDRLIHDLLDFATLQTGKLSLELKEERAGELVEEAVRAHEAQAIDKGVALTAAVDDTEAVVCCDRERILQVLGNLIGNAIKFCAPGDRIEVRARRLENGTELAVADTGPGIAPEAMKRIFDPYWSAQEHRKQGTGLGLFISRGIVEAHGSMLEVRRTEERGATFAFTLPGAAARA